MKNWFGLFFILFAFGVGIFFGWALWGRVIPTSNQTATSSINEHYVVLDGGDYQFPPGYMVYVYGNDSGDLMVTIGKQDEFQYPLTPPSNYWHIKMTDWIFTYKSDSYWRLDK